MYCPDTLQRLDEKAIEKEQQALKNKYDHAPECDICENRAKVIIPVYNPADALREPKICGAYSVFQLCQECADEEKYMDNDLFYCSDCGELFIKNHSWDTVCVSINGHLFCQECAIKQMKPIAWKIIKAQLKREETHNWRRINRIPDHEKIWEGEYAGYSDFSGYTSLDSVILELDELLKDNDKIYPIISQSYQFSVVLAVYK